MDGSGPILLFIPASKFKAGLLGYIVLGVIIEE
jgi:hypothetical protein